MWGTHLPHLPTYPFFSPSYPVSPLFYPILPHLTLSYPIFPLSYPVLPYLSPILPRLTLSFSYLTLSYPHLIVSYPIFLLSYPIIPQSAEVVYALPDLFRGDEYDLTPFMAELMVCSSGLAPEQLLGLCCSVGTERVGQKVSCSRALGLKLSDCTNLRICHVSVLVFCQFTKSR